MESSRSQLRSRMTPPAPDSQRVADVMTPTSSTAREQFIHEVVGQLWPGSTVHYGSGVRVGELGIELTAVPNKRKARLLVPAYDTRVAAAAFRGYKLSATRRERMALSVAAALARVGAINALPTRLSIVVSSDSSGRGIDEHLTKALGRNLSVVLQIGPARANRKAILQLVSSSGETLGFAKVGLDALTRELVREEASALSRLHALSPQELHIPDVLHDGQWNDTEVLVLKALPQPDGRKIANDELSRAMVEVACLQGVHESSVRDSPYLERLLSRYEMLQGATLSNYFSDVIQRLRAASLDVSLPLGSWHGDWTSWNMAATPTGLMVWDWERFQRGVPLGFDAIHCQLHDSIVCDKTDPKVALSNAFSRAPQLLAPFGLANEGSRLVAMLYAVELSCRYLADRQEEAGAKLGRVQDWVVPVLSDAVERYPRGAC